MSYIITVNKQVYYRKFSFSSDSQNHSKLSSWSPLKLEVILALPNKNKFCMPTVWKQKDAEINIGNRRLDLIGMRKNTENTWQYQHYLLWHTLLLHVCLHIRINSCLTVATLVLSMYMKHVTAEALNKTSISSFS